VESLKADIEQKTAVVTDLEQRCQQSTEGKYLMLILLLLLFILAGMHADTNSRIMLLLRCSGVGLVLQKDICCCEYLYTSSLPYLGFAG